MCPIHNQVGSSENLQIESTGKRDPGIIILGKDRVMSGKSFIQKMKRETLWLKRQPKRLRDKPVPRIVQWLNKLYMVQVDHLREIASFPVSRLMGKI